MKGKSRCIRFPGSVKQFCHKFCGAPFPFGNSFVTINTSNGELCIAVVIQGHLATFNPAVITNKEVHMVYGNMNKDAGASHAAAGGGKKPDLCLKFLIT